jgi:hypothetical protein
LLNYSLTGQGVHEANFFITPQVTGSKQASREMGFKGEIVFSPAHYFPLFAAQPACLPACVPACLLPVPAV